MDKYLIQLAAYRSTTKVKLCAVHTVHTREIWNEKEKRMPTTLGLPIPHPRLPDFCLLCHSYFASWPCAER